MTNVTALKKLALLGAIREQIQISSSNFAQHISYSTQTASRRLQALEKEGLIIRVIVPEGQKVLITQSGKDVLRSEYYEYQKIFEPTDNEIELHGKVVTGLGEGQYYMSLEGYITQFKSKLGFKPYPGTLNLVLTDQSNVLRKRLEESKGIPINGFTSENRTFGGGRCFHVNIGKINGAVVIPDRSHYPNDLLEVIASKNLRSALGIKNGGLISLKVLL